MTWALWLVGLVGPIVSRVLLSLGLSLVAVTGATAAASTLKATILSSFGAMPSAAVQLAGLFGIWEALGVWFGAITFVLTWHAATSSWGLARSVT